MVNKGMGYSINVVFLLWTIFNFYILRKVGKIENKAFFWITLVVLLISLLGTYVEDINLVFAMIVVCVVLLGIHFIGNHQKTGVRYADNFCFTLLFILTLCAFDDSKISYLVAFIAIVFSVGLIAVGAVRNYLEQPEARKINWRALLFYVVFIVILMVAELEVELVLLLGLFSLTVSMLFVSNKSIYKKVLAGILFWIIGVGAMDMVNIDEAIFGIIYLSAIIVGYAYLLGPVKVEALEEGDEEDDEE